METVLLTGGTGMIGTRLSKLLLSAGYRVIVLTRSTGKSGSGELVYARWDPATGYVDPAAISEADHIIHLAGENVAGKRWSKARKKEIVDSRVQSSELLVKALRELPNSVKTVVSASAIGWYGADRQPPQPFVENDPPDSGFLGTTCVKWEESVRPVVALGKRLVTFRISIVLSANGGAYPPMVRSLDAGVAAIIGSGDQVITWIHLEDLCRMFLFAIKQTDLNGVYNAASPAPVTNRDLILGAASIKRKHFLTVHVPAWALQLALGEMSVEVLKSATVSNEKITAAGFSFLYPDLGGALRELEEKTN